MDFGSEVNPTLKTVILLGFQAFGIRLWTGMKARALPGPQLQYFVTGVKEGIVLDCT